MKPSKTRAWLFLISGLLLASAAALWYQETAPQTPPSGGASFDGDRAYQDILRQVDLGPRTPGSPGQAGFIEWIIPQLEQLGWQTQVQETQMMGHTLRNIVASRGEAIAPWVILGAHYDTRLVADNDPDPSLRTTPVPGANDGASGVAVLLELARVLPPRPDLRVSMVFFDAEDNGNIPGWDWILGSTAFVQTLEGVPDAVIIVDMVGDSELTLYLEHNSDAGLQGEIWETARALGYENQFIPQYKYAITDDHIPFVRAGIPAVDIIDLDYPYWHTTLDTPDKVAPQSLRAVGHTLETWLAGFSTP